MEKKVLPNGFITLEDAVALINSDTRADAKVDTAFLVKNLPWLQKDRNYNIRLLRHENGKVVFNGNKYVFISSDYEKAILEHAIVEHYKEVTGRSIDPNEIGLRRMTAAVDTDKNPGGRPSVNKDSKTKFGDLIESGERISEE